MDIKDLHTMINDTPDNSELLIKLSDNKIGHYPLSFTDDRIIRVLLGNGSVRDVVTGIRQ